MCYFGTDIMGRKRTRARAKSTILSECPICQAAPKNFYVRGWADQRKTVRYLGCRKCGREFAERPREHPLFKSRLPLATIQTIVLMHVVEERGLRETARATKTRPETVRRLARVWQDYCWEKKKPWLELNGEEAVTFWKSVLVEIGNRNRAAQPRLEELARLSQRDLVGRQTWTNDVSTWLIQKTYKYTSIIKRRALLLLPEIRGATRTPAQHLG